MNIVLCLCAALSAGHIFDVTVPAGPKVPVSVELPATSPARSAGMAPQLVVVRSGKKAAVLCQVEEGAAGKRLWFFLPARTAAGVETFELSWVKHDGTPHAEVCDIAEAATGRFLFRSAEAALLAYNYDFVKKAGATPRYDRCDYLHPVFGPEREVLTDDFPEDHLHQRGIFWIWPRVLVGNESYDPWSLRDSRQWPRAVKLGVRGPVCASLEADVVWRSADGRPLVNEKFQLRVYRPAGTVKIVDLAIRLWAAAETKTQIGGRLTAGKGYGGLNVRFAPRTDAIITMDGKRMQEQLVNQKPARWSDFSAVFAPAKKRTGLAVCAHPKNPIWPERWCNRYYGILGAASPGLSLLTLKQNEPVVFRYRLVVHAGTSEDANCEGHSKRFVTPIEVKWR